MVLSVVAAGWLYVVAALVIEMRWPTGDGGGGGSQSVSLCRIIKRRSAQSGRRSERKRERGKGEGKAATGGCCGAAMAAKCKSDGHLLWAAK